MADSKRTQRNKAQMEMGTKSRANAIRRGKNKSQMKMGGTAHENKTKRESGPAKNGNY